MRKKLLVLFSIICFAFVASVPKIDGIAHPKTSFVIDILAPAGIPFVSFFHKIRQNSFLNSECTQAKGLEKIGNLFLSPNRFLFGGQVYNEKGEFLHNSFDYEKEFSARFFTSVIFLIPCQVLGSICKGLSLLTTEGKTHYTRILQAHSSLKVLSNIKNYRKKGVFPLYSSEIAPCQNYPREYGVSKKFQIELKALKEVIRILEKHQIPYWADCGSALGAYRHGGVIPWDCDIDLAILIEDHQNVVNALHELDPDQYEIQDWSSYRHPQSFLKLYIKESRSLMDFYHYQIHEETKTIQYFFSFHDVNIPESWKVYEKIMLTPHPFSTIFPLKKAKFEDFTIWVPNKLEKFLMNIYGENLSPTMVWDESSQKYQKVLAHPYWNQDIMLKNKTF